MWMMSYNDGAEFNMTDSFNGRKLRTLIPRPSTAASPNTATANSPYLSHIHGTDVLALNHHLATVAEQSKREFSTQQVVVSSRWNPTPEQLQTLEELYRRGTRTPSAEQIQHITAQLRRYGKIEGKNVFYWFQNHKARERQKRRRQLESVSDEQRGNVEIIERREPGANRTGFEAEQTKNWAPPTNWSTLAEKTVSRQRTAKAAVPEFGADGWVQFDEGESLQRRSLAERNATWQMMQLSCCSSTPLINSGATITAPSTVTAMDQSLFMIQDPNQLLSVSNDSVDEASGGGSQTLQLFPLRSGDGNHNGSVAEKESDVSTETMNANFTPYQFFEFIPLKN
ncbi:unnamed protein product [Ilex paraguariensis]|uniref:Homeobox domain-containing protein n=1 Tax=Ilex paraguariensis TaxID=185542 RepID=A0ABC8SGX0_9AQUA